MSRLLDFYLGTGTDHHGRTLAHILEWDDGALETSHDYIQWLFPTTQRSAFSLHSPELPEEDIAAFRTRGDLRENLLRSLRRMMSFYGLQVDEAEKPLVVPGPKWGDRSPQWLGASNHNHLRLSRILDCLSTLGMEAHAKALLSRLELVAASDQGRGISQETLGFWREAVKQ